MKVLVVHDVLFMDSHFRGNDRRCGNDNLLEIASPRNFGARNDGRKYCYLNCYLLCAEYRGKERNAEKIALHTK